MDLASILIPAGVAALVTLLLVGGASLFVLRRLRSVFQLETSPVADLDDESVPQLGGLDAVVPEHRCDGCRHFNLRAGQRVMATQPAFMQATSHLEPWQMARQRPVDLDPEYVALERKFLDAQAAGDVEGARELHDQLLAMDPGSLRDDRQDLDQSLMELDWQRLGLCGRHKELRFATDKCEEWSAE